MLEFDWPWVAALAPVPLLARYLLAPLASGRDAALRVPFLHEFTAAASGPPRLPAPRGLLWLAVLAWCLLIVAGMRPRWLGDFVELPQSGRDLMLAVDLSASMEERDFILDRRRVDRLTATKRIAGEFIAARIGDRLGLILFGERAYLQTPLTFDRVTLRTLLDEAMIGLAGRATAIGDAIGLAVKRLGAEDGQDRVLILLTDGANTAGVVEPLAAADLAARRRLRIYTIGIGADEMIVRSLFGSRRVNPSLELDEKTLQAIAEQTGGRYFRARDTDELRQIYGLLDELEPAVKDARRLRPQAALYYWPLSLALILMLTAIFLRHAPGRYRG